VLLVLGIAFTNFALNDLQRPLNDWASFSFIPAVSPKSSNWMEVAVPTRGER
jgi:hypothetical protein